MMPFPSLGLYIPLPRRRNRPMAAVFLGVVGNLFFELFHWIVCKRCFEGDVTYWSYK
ncbi:hypothetical protein BDW62DRAFT_190445 [Aspergillus aurantiobrunneus]